MADAIFVPPALFRSAAVSAVPPLAQEVGIAAGGLSPPQGEGDTGGHPTDTP